MQCTCLFAASKIRMYDLVGFSVNVDVCVCVSGYQDLLSAKTTTNEWKSLVLRSKQLMEQVRGLAY